METADLIFWFLNKKLQRLLKFSWYWIKTYVNPTLLMDLILKRKLCRFVLISGKKISNLRTHFLLYEWRPSNFSTKLSKLNAALCWDVVDVRILSVFVCLCARAQPQRRIFFTAAATARLRSASRRARRRSVLKWGGWQENPAAMDITPLARRRRCR